MVVCVIDYHLPGAYCPFEVISMKGTDREMSLEQRWHSR